MTRPEYRPLLVKSALNKVQGMPFKWSLNPYRGCAHSCHYCYARATHAYLDLGVAEEFSSIIFCKTNLPEVLAADLSKRSWRRESVAVGTATDPYQPVEGRYRLTRQALEVMARFKTPASIVTKGSMVIRDLDVLQELTAKAGATVCFSVPTIDPDIWRRVEPGTAPPWQRLRAMERLVANGVHAGIIMAPLLPGLSAEPERLAATVEAAAGHGAQFIGARLLHLEPGVRDYFLEFMESEYPTLHERYLKLYPVKYASSQYQALIDERVKDAKASAGFADRRPRFETQKEPVQLTLL